MSKMNVSGVITSCQEIESPWKSPMYEVTMRDQNNTVSEGELIQVLAPASKCPDGLNQGDEILAEKKQGHANFIVQSMGGALAYTKAPAKRRFKREKHEAGTIYEGSCDGVGSLDTSQGWHTYEYISLNGVRYNHVAIKPNSGDVASVGSNIKIKANSQGSLFIASVEGAVKAPSSNGVTPLQQQPPPPSPSTTAKTNVQSWTIDSVKNMGEVQGWNRFRVMNSDDEIAYAYSEENNCIYEEGKTYNVIISKGKDGKAKINMAPKEKKEAFKSYQSGASGKASSYFAGNVSAIVAACINTGITDISVIDRMVEYWASKTIEITNRLS